MSDVKIDYKQTHVTRSWKYTSPFIACRFDPTGQYLFAAAQDYTIQRWDLKSDKKTKIEAHDSWLRGFGFSLDGTTCYTAGYDGQLLFWNTAEDAPKPKQSIHAHDGWIRWVSVSPDGNTIATGGNDRWVKLWSAEDGTLLQKFSGHENHIYSTFFHPNGEFLLSGDLLGVVHQWDLKTGKSVRTLDAKDLYSPNPGQGAKYGGVRSMSLSPDGKHLACSGLHKASNPFGAVQEPLIVVFDWESGKQVVSQVATGIPKGIAWRAIYHPHGELIAGSGGGSGGFLIFWKGIEEKEFHKFKLPNTVLDMDLHANGMEIATAHHDRHLRISKMQPKS